MEKLQKLYDLYLKKGILTDKTSFSQFSSATPDVQGKLYDLGKDNGLFVSTDLQKFQTAWGVKKKDISEPVGDTEGTMDSTTEQAPASPFFLDSQSSDPIAERGIGFEEPDYANTDQDKKQLISADSQPSDPIADNDVSIMRQMGELQKGKEKIEYKPIQDEGQKAEDLIKQKSKITPAQRKAIDLSLNSTSDLTEIEKTEYDRLYDKAVESGDIERGGNGGVDASTLGKVKEIAKKNVLNSFYVDKAKKEDELLIEENIYENREDVRNARNEQISKTFLNPGDKQEYDLLAALNASEQVLSIYNDPKTNRWIPNLDEALSEATKANKLAEKNLLVYRESYLKQNIKDIDKAKYELSQDKDNKSLKENLLKAKSKYAAFINPVEEAKKIFTENPKIQEEKGDTNLEKFLNYFDGITLQYKEATKGMTDAELALTIVPIVDELSGAGPEFRKAVQLYKEMKTLSPIALLNRKALSEDNFFTQLSKSLLSGLSDGTTFTTEQEESSIIFDALAKSETISSVSEDQMKALESSFDMTRGETIGSTLGATLSMMPAFFAAGAGVTKLKNITKLGKAFDKVKDMNRVTKLLLGATESGVTYEAAQLFGDETVAEEASFMSGALGEVFVQGLSAVAKRNIWMSAMVKAFGKNASRAQRYMAIAAQRGGMGFGEVAEEYGNEIGAIINESEGSLKKVKDLFLERFGTLDQNLEFGIMTFGMGVAFGSATNAGKGFANSHKEWLSNQSDEVKSQFNQLANEVSTDMQEVVKETAPVAEEIVTETAPVVEEAVVEEAVAEEAVVEEVAAKTRQENISERSNKNLFEDQRSSKELPYNKGKDGKGRADIYDITKPDEKGVATAQYASPDGSVDIIVSAKNDKNFVGYTRIYENGEPTNMFTAKMESTGDAFKNMITSAEAKLPDNAEVVEETSISEGGLKVYNKSNLTEKLDEDGNVVTRPTKYSAATKESVKQDGQSAYNTFTTTDIKAAEAEVANIKAAYPGIKATIKEGKSAPSLPPTPGQKKTAPGIPAKKKRYSIDIDLPVLIKSQETKTEAVAEEAAMSKKVGASINEKEAEKAAPVETTTEEITIFRGLQPKRDVKGKPKTVHKIKKGKFGSDKIEGTDGNKGTKPIKKFTIPAGTTVETVKLPGNTPAATSRVELETEAIDNSTAQVVKLETIDAGGRETQYIIKDDSLLESGVDMTAEEEASARSKPKKRIISDEAYAKAEKELKDMMGNLSSGTGFKGAGALAVVVARKLEDGAISVAEMTTEMVKIFGEKIRPHVKAAYDTATKPKQKQKRKSKTQKDIDDTVSDKRNKVTVDEIVALKSQIKVLDRGAKTAKKSIETATKNLAAEVKELVKKGKINVSQMTSVMNKFSKVDMFKEEKIEEFVDYMTKVFNDADYANKIINAKSVVAKIKKQSKKGEVTISTAGKEFAKINPSLVDDIDLFLEQADKVLQGLQKTTKSDLAKGNTKETFNIKEVNEYVSSTIESQDKKIYDAKRKTFHNTTGIDPSELTLKEMDSLLNKLTGKELTEEEKAKESKDKSEIIDKAAKNAFANFSESVSIGIKDGSIKVSKDAKKTIGKFLKIDLALLNTENKILAIDAIINFKTNPEATGGMGALSDQYKGNEGMFDLSEQNIAANTRSTGTGEIWSINLSTLPLAIESYFKSQSKALKVMDKIGIDGVVNGSAKAETDANKLTEVYAKKFKKKKMKKGKYFDDFNEIERGVLAFVRRTVSGTIEEKKIEFNRRKKMVKETYVELLKSTDNVSKKTGELIEASYDKLVAKSENYNEVDKKADPVNLEGVEHVSKDWENLYPDLASVALDYYNINLGKDLNFTPDNLVLTGKEDTKSDIDKPIYNPDPGLRDEESGRLKENNRINALPKGRILSLGFDTQNYRNLKDAMTDINTAPSIKQIKGAMDSKYFEKVFVNESSRRVIKDKIYKYVELKRGKDFETPLNKNILRKLGRTTALGVRMVLGGVTQPMKQIVPLSNTIVNAGIVNTTAAAKLMLDKEVRDAVNNSGLPIANRGASSQGDIESVNSRIKNTTENILNKFITKSDQLNKYIIDKTLVYTDVAVAKTSFVAYYIKAMKKNGVEASDIDWTKPLDKEAGAYAMQQVNRQQNVSDSDLQGAFFTDKKIVTQLVRKTAFTFANFLINQKTRTYSDINTLFRNPTANKGDKAAALRSLGGLGVETIAFNAVGLALNEGITAIYYALKGEDESEEEKEKRRKNQIKGKAGNIVKDLISPIPLVDDFVVGAANLALELMADPEDEDPFQLFSNDTKTFVQRMGVLGIPLQKLSNLYEMGRIVATGEIENEYMGKKTTKKVSDENIDYMRTVAPIYLLYISGGLGLSEIGYMSEKALKEVKRSKVKKSGGSGFGKSGFGKSGFGKSSFDESGFK